MPATAEHIHYHAIHKLMLEMEKLYHIPPCRDLSIYLATLERRGIVSCSQADMIRDLYSA